MILSLFPLAYTSTRIDGFGNSNWFRIAVDPTGPMSHITYAHERYHTSYRWRHPIKIWTRKGREETEELAHAVEAILRAEILPDTSFARECDGLALNMIGWGGYAGMWPDIRTPIDGVFARALSDRVMAKCTEAQAWLAKNRGEIDRVAKKLKSARQKAHA